VRINKLIYTALFLFCLSDSIFSQAVLSGSIKEAGTMLPLPGATIYIPDLKTGVSADENGHYKINNLPKSTLVVQVRFVGFAPVTEIINLAVENTRDFLLSQAAIESQEVVITGSGISTDNRRSSIAIVPVGKQQLFSTPSTNIIDAIGDTPGLSQITTGPNASKPVIRGLSYSLGETFQELIKTHCFLKPSQHG
jgi:iron complex outermembrane receptor protein